MLGVVTQKASETLVLLNRARVEVYALEVGDCLTELAEVVENDLASATWHPFLTQRCILEKVIEIALGDGVAVAGRIDLVRRVDTGEVTIVDLKSNDRAQAEAVTETQLHIYALGYRELTGRDADYVEIYELDEQKQKRRSVDDDFIEDVKRDVRAAAAALRQNVLPASPGKKTCGQCDYINLCSAAIQK